MDTPTGLPTTPIDLAQAYGVDPRRMAPTDAAQAATLAQEFEGMLMLQMVRQMRQSLLSEEDQEQGLGNDRWTETFDVEFSRFLAQKGGVGLADFIKRQLAAGAEGAKTDPAQPQQQQQPPANGAAGAAIKSADVAVPLAPRAPIPTISPNTVAASASVASANIAPANIGPRLTPQALEADADDDALTLPLDGATTSKFGWRGDPFHGRRRFHSGVDLRAAYGTDVPAAGAGRVAFAGERGGYGTLVVVQHEDGVETRYAHLSGTDVKEGDRVDAGQVIGRVGSSGRSTAPHLHFEVLVNGARVDPELVAARNPDTFKFGRPVVD